ncbi:MAG: hypothetical protein M3Q19_08560 [Pseudomonadota bacterium]|nr:hypothetical protein [Pseudomonadota bacterium]
MKSASLFRTCALALAAVALGPTTARAADAPKFAWGKAGVSYDQYRDEAYECAMVGLDTNIENTEPVERLRKATRQLEALDNRQGVASSTDPMGAGIRHAQDLAAIKESARAEQQVKELKKILFAAMQKCMVQRGYTRFALTEDQRREVAKFKNGSPERRAFLYKLGSDPAILEQQKQPLPAE